MMLRLVFIKNIVRRLRPVFAICIVMFVLVIMGVSTSKANATARYNIPQTNSGFNISGYVYDEKGEPVVGAFIISMENTSIGTTTDENGFFRFRVPSANNQIQVSIIGFKKQLISINGKSEFKINLQSDVEELGEFVVMGYFSKAKNSFTGTDVYVEGDELRTVNNTSFFDALKVFDPSFQIVDTRELNGANPNFIPDQISIRGENSFPEISESELQTNVSLPIFLLDGFEVNVQKVYDLDMNRIESVTILKDASASAIYGSRAANGVIVIETKLPEAGVLKVSYTLNGTFQIPDLSSYNLMNASEVLEFQRLAGQFVPSTDITNPGSYQNTYNLIKKEVMAGVDNDWLKKPLRTGFQHRHTIMVEGSVKPQDVYKESNMRYAVNLSVA
ncbi:MAG: TonB-dependent receptor plug domain-containing protein [Odoribacter sp.]|nr:TonB-dependent receptor plug domain-containing protein [Odoribacter sp.]